jgi:hypothetical protein
MWAGVAAAQPAAATAEAPGTVVTRTIQGRVINAAGGAAIPRVMVMLNNRVVLTDAQGRFEFPDFTETRASVRLTKPGFSQSPDGSDMFGGGAQTLTDLDAVAELKLYPDAVVTGVLTGRDALPLTGVQVMLHQAQYQATGIRWITTKAAQTNLRGEYRFLVPPGRYQLSTSFVMRSRDTGEAVLPVSFPAGSGSSDSTYFTVASGEEKHIDLRPRTGPGYPITVRVDPPEAQRGIQFTAVTSGGESFNVPSSGQVEGGYRLTLPSGSYTLHGKIYDRNAMLDGTTKVTVTPHQNEPAVLHLEPAASLPVELALDPGSGATSTASAAQQGFSEVQQVPDLRQFNLRLHNLAAGPGMNEDISLQQREDKTYEFRVVPGRYRLESMGGGQWYVESATYGVANLLTSDITISSGGSSAPIRLVVNNATGTVSVSVRFGSLTGTAWVYLVPRGPSLAPVNPLGMGNSGSATGMMNTRIPVGSYTVLAVDHRLQEDVRDPEVLAKFSNAQQVDVSASATANVSVDIARERETKQ